MVRPLEAGDPLGEQAVLAAIVAVVGDVEHQRVLGLPGRIQRGQQLPEQIVEVGAVGPEVADAVANLALGELAEACLAHPLIDRRLVGQVVGVGGR